MDHQHSEYSRLLAMQVTPLLVIFLLDGTLYAETTISSVVEVKSVFYKSVLEVRAKHLLDIPGTTTSIH